MADYISSLNGAQMDAALLDMAEHNSEAYAVGQRNGFDVDSSDITYHNNAKYYAEEAARVIPGTGTAAVRYDVPQVLTEDEKAQARTNIGAEQTGIASNPNLLDNPFFTINQRGASGTLSGAFIADRWSTNGGTVNITHINGGGIHLTATGGWNVNQKIPNVDYLEGRTVTLSAIVNGTLYQQSGVVTPSGYIHDMNTVGNLRIFTAYKGSSYTDGIYLRLTHISSGADTDVIITAVKLEIGSVSTLANDSAPDYAMELLKCQWDYQEFNAAGLNDVLLLAMGVNATVAYVPISLPVPLRRSPTAYVSHAKLIGNANVAVTSVAVHSAIGNAIVLTAVASGLTSGQSYVLGSDGSGRLKIQLTTGL